MNQYLQKYSAKITSALRIMATNKVIILFFPAQTQFTKECPLEIVKMKFECVDLSLNVDYC